MVIFKSITASIIKDCHEHGISISGIVSDNANIVAALTNMDQNDPLSLRALISLAVLRCACAAHTSQLAVNDVMKTSFTLEKFFNDITSLLKWIVNRAEGFEEVCPLKVPKYIATRWNTLASCASFIIKKADTVNAFIEERVAFESERYNLAMDLFLALSTIKMCLRYKEKYL